MSEEKLPPSVIQFISQHLTSIEQLEILAFLLSSPEAAFTPQSVYNVVRSNLLSIQRGLDHFANIGILERISTVPVAYRAAWTQELHDLLRDICQCYKTMSVRVIEAVYAPDRIKLEAFANAFKLKQDK